MKDLATRSCESTANVQCQAPFAATCFNVRHQSYDIAKDLLPHNKLIL